MRHQLPVAIAFASALLTARQGTAQSKPTVEQFMSPASPLELVSARKADRVAWMTYEKGLRNVYSAAAPNFTPVRLTRFLEDDGTDVSNVRISDDGSTIVFVRGSAPNRQGWVANPSHDPDGGEQAIWGVRTTGGPAFKVVAGGAPELSPDGRSVVYIKDGQVFSARVRSTGVKDSTDLGLKPFIKAWGTQRTPRWSPDGSRLAFVSMRGNHSFIGVYDMKTRRVSYLAPSVDFDDAPRGRLPGKRSCSRDAQVSRSVSRARSAATALAIRRARLRDRDRRADRAPTRRSPVRVASATNRHGRRTTPRSEPGAAGLCRATFTGGHTLSVMMANVTTGEARELWHNAPNDSVFTNINVLVVGRWPRRVPAGCGDRRIRALLLHQRERQQPGACHAHDDERPDRECYERRDCPRTGARCTTAREREDIERRHIWAVPTAGGTPRRVTTGNGIETHPQPLAFGKAARRAVLRRAHAGFSCARTGQRWRRPHCLSHVRQGFPDDSPRRTQKSSS